MWGEGRTRLPPPGHAGSRVGRGRLSGARGAPGGRSGGGSRRFSPRTQPPSLPRGPHPTRDPHPPRDLPSVLPCRGHRGGRTRAAASPRPRGASWGAPGDLGGPRCSRGAARGSRGSRERLRGRRRAGRGRFREPGAASRAGGGTRTRGGHGGDDTGTTRVATGRGHREDHRGGEEGTWGTRRGDTRGGHGGDADTRGARAGGHREDHRGDKERDTGGTQAVTLPPADDACFPFSPFQDPPKFLPSPPGTFLALPPPPLHRPPPPRGFPDPQTRGGRRGQTHPMGTLKVGEKGKAETPPQDP